MAWRLGGGEHVPMYRRQPGDATDQDGQHHRPRDPPRRVVDLFSDVAARLES